MTRPLDADAPKKTSDFDMVLALVDDIRHLDVALQQAEWRADRHWALARGYQREMEQAEARAVAAEADARRYRWAINYGGENDTDTDDVAWGIFTAPCRKEVKDAAIDAAQEAKK